MFVLLAVPIGLLAGLLLGGRFEHLTGLRLRWANLAVAGLIGQVAIFSDAFVNAAPDLVPPLYVASTAAVLVAVLANIRTAGMPIVAFGATLNLVAVLANGGYMPADPGALALAGLDQTGAVHLNSVANADPTLKLLTDVFAIPAGAPFATVFSLGDVILAIGIAWVIAAAMRGPERPVEARA